MCARLHVFLAPLNVVRTDDEYHVVVFRREVLHRRLDVFYVGDGVTLFFFTRPSVVGTSDVYTCEHRRNNEINV